MKVGVDISQIAHNGGVSTYTKNLVNKLEEIEGVKLELLYMSFRKPYTGTFRNVHNWKIPPSLFEKIFNRWRFVPVETLIGEVDIFHSSDWIQPPSKAKKVTTYHDVIPLKYPEWSHPKIVEVHKKRLELVEREVDLVITVSETTKKDLLEISKIPESKIVVIYEGVDKRFQPQSSVDIQRFKQKYGLPERFILAIGGIGKRRNLELVKKACAGYELVITGENIKYLSDEEMPLLYVSSELLLYPSLYEGFGLPILEAMSCGIPVITSNHSSMAEIAGDAALLANSSDQESVTNAVKLVMDDKKLYKELVSKGLNHVKKFSWDKCAKETVAAYKTLLK